MHSDGIVNLTRVRQTEQHEQANTQLPTSPVSRIVKQLSWPSDHSNPSPSEQVPKQVFSK